MELRGKDRQSPQEEITSKPDDSINRFLLCHHQGMVGMIEEDIPITGGMGPLYRLGGISAAVQLLNECREKQTPITEALGVVVEVALIEYAVNHQDLYESDKQLIELHGRGDKRIKVVEQKLAELLPQIEPAPLASHASLLA